MHRTRLVAQKMSTDLPSASVSDASAMVWSVSLAIW